MHSEPSACIPAHPNALRRFRLILALGLLMLFAHIAWFTLHTDHAARAFDACTVPANTIPGLPEPRFFPDNDPYAWLAHTRDLMASGNWRIRHTFMDNAPYGREMHWSHPLIWTLWAMASGIGTTTGWPPARSIELAGIWVMPLFQFLFLGTTWLILARKLGWVPAAAFTLLCLSVSGCSNAFYPLLPDHHGLQLAAGLLSFICLQFGGMGWIRSAPLSPPPYIGTAFRSLLLPDLPAARHWFIAAGILGGLALWLGATVWLISLALTVLAASTVLPAVCVLPPGSRYHPSLWRLWAFAGILTAFGGYLLEYAPTHFSMRLEVNHPVYWLCWIGIAEMLRFAGGSRTPRFWLNRRKTDWLQAAAGLVCATVLPILVIFGPDSWHHLHDPLLQRLHAGFINEFQPGWTTLLKQPIDFLFTNFNILPVFAAGTIWVLIRSRRHPRIADVFLRPAVVLAVLYILITLLQLRWGFLAVGTLIWLAVLSLVPDVVFSQTARKRWILATAILLVGGLAADMLRIRSENRAAIALEVPTGWIKASLAKRRALQWGLAAGTNQWRMIGLATEAPMLYYFAGIQTVASYYWENTAGWHAETSWFADQTPEGEQARQITRQRGLTHAFAKPNDSLPRLYLTIQSGSCDPSLLTNTMGGRLAGASDAPLPFWIHRDNALSTIAHHLYAFQTPEGLIGEYTVGQVFQLKTENESDHPQPQEKEPTD